jgi:hypothetical protein
MARASYVYVVMGLASRRPVAAFTVKHELVRWLATRRGTSQLAVYRLGDGCTCDGPDGCKVRLDIDYLLDNPTRSGKVIDDE